LDKFNIGKRLDVIPNFLERPERKFADGIERNVKETRAPDLSEDFCLVG
jgi:hypothetical protein